MRTPVTVAEDAELLSKVQPLKLAGFEAFAASQL